VSRLARTPSPHLLAVALSVGLVVAHLARVGSSLLALAAVVVALAGLLVAPSGRLLVLAAALLLAGWWWGSVRLQALDRSVLVSEIGRTAPMHATVTGPARRGTFGLRLPAEVSRLGALAVHERVLLELPLGRAPPQGAQIELIGRIRRPRSESKGFDESAWLRRQGVHVVVRGRYWRVVGRRGGLAGLGDRLHARLAATIAPGLEGERRALVAGVVLGEDEGLSEALRESFRASGLYHLLAVSGQNVAFLAGGVLLLAWLLGVRRWLGECAVLAAIGAYVIAVGWQPSVVRAGIAGGLAALAWLASRQRDRWYFLLVGAIALLAWNPYNALEPGFQLSFGAVASIFVAVPRIEAALRGYPVPRPLATVLAVSLACGLATAPILWLHFGAVPLFSVASNALAAPVIAPLLGLGLAAALLEPVLPTAALALSWVNGWLAAYLAGCARLVGGLPHAEISSWAGLVLLVVATVTLFLWRLLPSWRRRHLAAVLAAGLAALAAWHMWPSPSPAPPTGLRITFLDVGQGDAVLLQVPEGAVLVDQGPPEANVAAQLRDLAVSRLSLLVLTHPQRDHVGGAADVIERLRCELILDPRLTASSADQTEALAAAGQRQVPIALARSGRTYRLGALTLRVLWPTDSGTPAEDPNLNATVLLASYGETDALLTADAESNVTLPLRPPPVEILKVAHHGSSDPGLPRLLDLVRPRVAVISVGRANDYGHPTPSTVGALEAASHLAVFRTDQDGRITIDSDGRRLEVRAER
jgi:competence protein ComEC